MGVSPSTKETTLYHFRDPLVEYVQKDETVDLVGVTYIGSPEDNRSKMFLSTRLGMLAEALDVDGVIVFVEGYGNQHIDMAAQFEELGTRNIPTVGLTYMGNGGLVVDNEFMDDNIVDLDKSGTGRECRIVCRNTIMPADVLKALKKLKTNMNNK